MCKVQSVGTRHHDIGNNQVGGFFLQIGHALFGIQGSQHPIVRQAVGQQVEHLLVVVNRQDGRCSVTGHLGQWTSWFVGGAHSLRHNQRRVVGLFGRCHHLVAHPFGEWLFGQIHIKLGILSHLAVNLYPSAQQLGQIIADGHADAVTRSLTGIRTLFYAVEHGIVVENALSVLRCNTPSGVIYREQQSARLLGEFYFDGALTLGVFKGVGYQVAHNASQGLVVGCLYQAGFYLLFVADATAFGHLGKGIGIVAYHCRYIHAPPADYVVACGHTAQIDHFLYQTIQSAQVLHHPADVFPHKLVGFGVRQYTLAGTVNQGQRRVQFVYHIGQELQFLFIQFVLVLLLQSGQLHLLVQFLVLIPVAHIDGYQGNDQ